MVMVMVCVTSPTKLWDLSMLKMQMGDASGSSGRPNCSATEVSMKVAFALLSSNAGIVV